MKKISVFLFIGCCLNIGFVSCKSSSKALSTVANTAANQKEMITISGVVQKQGTTTYQYGTHILKDESGKTIYALKSDALKLDNYINKKVQVRGTKLEGYPIEGGPDYLEVLEVKE